MIDKDYLVECLAYDKTTGVFIWNKRPAHHFVSAWAMSAWNGRYAGTMAGTASDQGYLKISLHGKQERAHRLAWIYESEGLPTGEIDHINGDRMDNRISNLRDVTRLQNTRNKRQLDSNTSGVTGVSMNRSTNRWRAYISIQGKRHHIGYYSTLDEARSARKSAEFKIGFHENHGRIV